MTPRDPTPAATPSPPVPTAQFARAVLGAAAEAEAAEMAVKRAILSAAEAGDCGRVRAIVTAWLEHPPTVVAESLALAPHGRPESTARGEPE